MFVTGILNSLGGTRSPVISGVRRKFPRGGSKVSSQSCDVTNQLYWEYRRHNHSKVVRGHAPGKFFEITPKNTHFRVFWKQVLV